jgi:hypothetical protein
MMLRFASAADVERAIPIVDAHLGRDGLLAYPT